MTTHELFSLISRVSSNPFVYSNARRYSILNPIVNYTKIVITITNIVKLEDNIYIPNTHQSI